MSDQIKPISPDEVATAKTSVIPYFVIAAVNHLIIKKWNGRSALIKQSDLIAEILSRWPDRTDREADARQKIFDEHWLDVETLYRAEGWAVVYDEPGLNESYEATFEFRPAKK